MAARSFARSFKLAQLRRDAVRDGFVVAAVLWCLAIAASVVTWTSSDLVGWYEHRLPNPYVVRVYDAPYGFFFTPPIAFAMYPIVQLPWPLAAAIWTGIAFAALYYLVGRWAALAILLPPVWWELQSGNISLLLAAASLAMLRWPAIGSFLALTKITPAVGFLWFAVRREWRSLGTALGATAIISIAIFAIAPGLWYDWFDRIRSNLDQTGPPYFVVRVPLAVRLVAASLLVAWGGLTGRPWTLPVAVTVAVPVLWYNALAGLVGAVRAHQLAIAPKPLGRPNWRAWPRRAAS